MLCQPHEPAHPDEDTDAVGHERVECATTEARFEHHHVCEEVLNKRFVLFEDTLGHLGTHQPGGAEVRDRVGRLKPHRLPLFTPALELVTSVETCPHLTQDQHVAGVLVRVEGNLSLSVQPSK